MRKGKPPRHGRVPLHTQTCFYTQRLILYSARKRRVYKYTGAHTCARVHARRRRRVNKARGLAIDPTPGSRPPPHPKTPPAHAESAELGRCRRHTPSVSRLRPPESRSLVREPPPPVQLLVAYNVYASDRKQNQRPFSFLINLKSLHANGCWIIEGGEIGTGKPKTKCMYNVHIPTKIMLKRYWRNRRLSTRKKMENHDRPTINWKRKKKYILRIVCSGAVNSERHPRAFFSL